MIQIMISFEGDCDGHKWHLRIRVPEPSEVFCITLNLVWSLEIWDLPNIRHHEGPTGRDQGRWAHELREKTSSCQGSVVNPATHCSSTSLPSRPATPLSSQPTKRQDCSAAAPVCLLLRSSPPESSGYPGMSSSRQLDNAQTSCSAKSLEVDGG